jgi:DNA polymerase (family X)
VESPPLSNVAIAERFELLGDLLELEGAVVYRILAYRRAAQTLRETAESVARLSAEGRLTSLPGVGQTIADKVAELLGTGEIAALTRLVDRNPPGAVAVMRLQGVGPKTARRIFAELELKTVDDVREAAGAGRIRALSGMGEKTEAAILAGLADGDGAAPAPRRSIARARTLGEKVLADLRACDGVIRCELAGSVRRYRETSKDVDVVAAVSDRVAAAEASGWPRSSPGATAASPRARTTGPWSSCAWCPPAATATCSST